MRIIDLLNKIANGEEVPDAIKWGSHDFEWFVSEYKAKGELGEPTLLDFLSQCPQMLNDKIITFYKIKEPQEHKIPEKFEIYDNSIEWCCNGRSITDNEKDIMDKINKIIDCLEKLK